MRIDTFVTDSLGDASHLLIDNGVAAVIDPQRDVRPYVEAANRAGATIEYVFETHVHNDYVSGGRELAELGARVVVPSAARVQFPHLAIEDSDELQVGGASFRAVAAPGHTYEHTAYIASVEGDSLVAFTGGSLLMASAGRSDLLGPEHTEALTRAQWDSIRKLAATLHPDSTIYPTHGAGSFCSSTGSSTDRFGALATEQGRNPVLTLATYELFRELHMRPAPTPGYYPYISPINRAGAKVYGAPPAVERIDSATALSRISTGATAVDMRAASHHAAGNLRGSLSIEYGPSFLAYTGWFVPFNAPLVLVADSVEAANHATLDLFRIGYERVQGVLLASDIPPRERASFSPATVDEAEQALQSGNVPLIDVRFAHEQDAAPLAGAIAAPIDRLAANDADFPGQALTICESGYRAAIAASFLRNRGVDALPVFGGGVSDLLERQSVRA